MTTFVALGSNLGDSKEILRAACLELARLPRTRLIGQSTFHQTEAVGGPADQPDYFNAVVELSTELGAIELLRALQAIELAHGRDRSQEARWGPRRLDLDLLLHGTEGYETEDLELPHPRMEERSFVLEPLAELQPDLLLGRCGRTVREQCDWLRGASLR